MRPIFLVVLVWGVVASIPARATYVLPIGEVVISHGDGFYPINSKTEVGAGDTVVANPGGVAKIVYPDGCVIEVTPGNVVTVEGYGERVVAEECKQPSANLGPSFIVGAELVAQPQVGAIIAKDAEHWLPVPAGP